jgi:hypothetical protein
MSAEWIPADWPAPDGIVAGCTTREGGISKGKFTSLNLGSHVGDSIEHVTENRRRLALLCKLPAEPLWLNQLHGTDVAVDPESGTPPAADAVLTREPDRVCAVMTADCLPVLLVSASGDELAAAHAGWRGLCNGVLENTVYEFQALPADILAWFGPAISPRNFEVGDDVRQAFVSHDDRAAKLFVPNANGRWQADLYSLARQRLNEAGVQRIYGGDACTYDDSRRFFSYRRDGQCGRMASFVFRYS